MIAGCLGVLLDTLDNVVAGVLERVACDIGHIKPVVKVADERVATRHDSPELVHA